MLDMGVGVSKKAKRRLAEQLCVLYHEAVRSEVSNLTGGRADRGMPSLKLSEVDESARRSFMKAAVACIELDADVREFVVAQFATWRAASAYHKKFLLPQPTSFATLAARVRYLQFKATDAVRGARMPPPVEDKDVRRRFFVEERHLNGLARMQRRDPADVITEQPEQFSREFLRHKGVWDLVGDAWEERQS